MIDYTRIESIIIFKATVSCFPGVQGSRFFNFRSFGKIQFALDAPCKESAQSKPASKCVCGKVHLTLNKNEGRDIIWQRKLQAQS